MKTKIIFLIIFILLSFGLAQKDVFNSALINGKLGAAERVLLDRLEYSPSDTLLYQLGVIQFLRSIENLSQSWYKYGNISVDSLGMLVPVLRLPVPANPNPEEITYEKFRQVFINFNNDLAKSQETLSKINDDNVKLELHFDKIRLDLDGNGKASEDELLLNLFMAYNQAFDGTGEEFIVSFDKADVYWLRGYTHLIMSMLDTYLAYDGRELFERTAQLSFAKPNTPYNELFSSYSNSEFPIDIAEIVDLVAFFHLINLPLEDASKMKSALKHLKEVIRLSRLNWQTILAETDNDNEWIPNPNQDSVVPVEITSEMIEGWQMFLDEAEDILNGKKLIPYWRVADGQGVNLNKFFTEPSKFDLILWIQGTDALAYIEKGELSSRDTWQQLQELFQGNFIGFAIWFN